jgi:excisionase family DNA binding protein
MSGDLAFAVPDAVVDAIARRVAALVAEQGRAVTDPPPVAESDRLSLTKAEAAESLGVSVDHLERHVLPGLRVIRSGRLRLVPVSELKRWVDEHAARALEAER